MSPPPPPGRRPPPQGRRGPPRPGGAPPGRRPPPGRRAPPTAPRKGPPPGARRRGPSGRQEAQPDPNDPTIGRGDKQFVIKKGRRRSDDEPEDDAPLGAVILPKSMTQEAEGENFKKRFGVEQAVDLTQRHGKVQLTDSMGALGPDIKKKGLAALLFLLLVAVVAYAIHVKIGFPALLEKLTGG